MMPKFKKGDTVKPKGYLISGDIIHWYRVRNGYRYRVIFDDWPEEEFNEKDLILCE